MMNHPSRAATAIDWRDETDDETGCAAESAPRLSDTEIIASLGCPVGRLHLEPSGMTEQAGPAPVVKGRVTAFPSGEAYRTCRSLPNGKAGATTLGTRQARDPLPGRVRGITDNTL